MHIADFSVGMLGANGIVVPACLSPLVPPSPRSWQRVTVWQWPSSGMAPPMKAPSTAHSTWLRSGNPAIFVCENNHWAIAVPASYALSVSEVSARASAYNIPGVTVDGTDVLAVYEAAAQAVQRARAGEGPTCWSA